MLMLQRQFQAKMFGFDPVFSLPFKVGIETPISLEYMKSKHPNTKKIKVINTKIKLKTIIFFLASESVLQVKFFCIIS